MAEPGNVSPSVEDYAKAVYVLETRTGGAVSTNTLAERLEITPGSASGMVRKLAEQGLVEHERYRGVRLTDAGRTLALRVIRRHRLIEQFLAAALGMPWDRVHDEAEVLEHVLSGELERLIAAHLGDPDIDPHGDPIPTADFVISEPPTRSLDELPIGTRARFVRVSDSDPAKLRYLAEHAIAIGADLEVVDRQPFGGPLFVRFGDMERPIGGELAAVMRVVTQEDE